MSFVIVLILIPTGIAALVGIWACSLVYRQVIYPPDVTDDIVYPEHVDPVPQYPLSAILTHPQAPNSSIELNSDQLQTAARPQESNDFPPNYRATLSNNS